MIDKKTTFEAAILPSSVVFNRDTGNFEYIMSTGERQIMEVSPK
jgi:hypothetical protein